MQHFTPVPALTGGIMIGAATVLYLLLNGRYAGISGIARSALFGDPDRSIDVSFVVGLLVAGLAAHWLAPQTLAPGTGPWWTLAVGGMLVGAGTALGGGCTSGHGVCGLGRLSLRSLVAVAVFVASGIATVAISHLAQHSG